MARKKEEEFEEKDSEGFFQKLKFRLVQPSYIVILFIVILVLTLLASYLAFSEANQGFEKISVCGDGTFHGTCSLDRPFYCDEGVLTEKASLCGCRDFSDEDNDFSKEGEFCISDYNIEPKDIPLRYILDGEIYEFNLTTYEGIDNYISNISREITYEGSEIPFRVNFKLYSFKDDVQRQGILQLVKKIQNIAPESKADQARIAVSLVQNIPYGFSNETVEFAGEQVDYSRYPYEVLFDNEGICGEKSDLMALLLKELGFGISIFYFQDENHEAVGIKCPIENSLKGSGFCFVETGGPAVISDSGIEFVGGIKLNSEPEVMLISEGISLPEGMKEYRDAKTLNQIRDRNFLGILKSWRYEGIKEKYGLDGIYELD